ncbi:hypothetical protein TWF718_008533 [Orbilia javanica]|uniref:Uncharacterized protein n=1 Tax=Orbilia javanica TaxID=47235 RepID=A0AAN8MN39_9PEZI
MASSGHNEVAKEKTEYKVLPLIVSEEYNKLPIVKLSLWDKRTRSWVQILSDNLGPSVGVRYTIRDSGVHLMAIQQFECSTQENLSLEENLESSNLQFGRVASLVFGKTPGAGPILYNIKKVPRDSRRPLDGKHLQFSFRVLDGGIVFGIENTETDTSLKSASIRCATLALEGMLKARANVLSFQNQGGSLWLRLETSETLDPQDGPLRVLWSSKSMWLGVSERILPWYDTENIKHTGSAGKIHQDNIIKAQASGKRQIGSDGSLSANQTKCTLESESLAISHPSMTLDAFPAPRFTLVHLETSLKRVTVFYWEPRIQNWTRILPETSETTFSLSLNFQLSSNGVELGLLHQVPVSKFSPEPLGNRTTQVLGGIKWYVNGNTINTIQYHIRMKDDDSGDQLPVFYINLPQTLEMELADKGGEIFDSMIDIAHQIFLEVKHKTQGESFSNRWLCIKASTNQNLASTMEVLQREGSLYLLCRSSAVPRRPKPQLN